VNDILDYGKIESGKMDLDSIDFDLERIARTVLETFKSRAEEKGVVLGSHFHPGLPSRFKGDPGRIRQILYNVVGNAVKYTQEGYITLRLEPWIVSGETSTLESNPATGIRILVEDSGIGMEKSQLERLFLPLLEGSMGNARRLGGTGLGLAISKMLVELMKGRLEVESQPGIGSTFSLTLPLPPGEVLSPPLADLSCLREKQVWVVDDISVARDVLEKSLYQFGVKVLPLESGEQACRLLADAEVEKPDVILTDWRMPEMDGLELTSWIRTRTEFSKLPVLLITSGAVRGDAQKARESGCDGFLVKPVAEKILTGALCLAISRPRWEGAPLITQHLISELGYDSLEVSGTLASRSAPVSTSDWSPTEPLHVLVVEDNVLNQKVALRMLKRLGCRTSLAVDGLEAVEARFEVKPDLILMDLMMPRVDGIEAALAIRQREVASKVSRIPIIACSAGVTPEEKTRCFASGMNEFLEKPIPFDALSALMEKFSMDRNPLLKKPISRRG
jgi:CheY-like chemotaxis protein